jgi:hypothetical protein
MADEILYENPSTKGDAGTRLEPMMDTGGLAPSQIVARVKKHSDLMRSVRRPYDQPWDRYRRYYGGDHWFNKLRSATKARPAPNYVFADIETIIPYMTDQRPAINVVAKRERGAKKADLMQDAVRSVFQRNEMDTKEVYVLKDAHIYGTGISKQHYDPELRVIKITPIDTRYFFVAPGAVEIQPSKRVAIIVNRFVSEMEDDFPHLKGKIGLGDATDEALTHKPVTPNKLYEQDSSVVINSDGGELMNTADRGSEEPSRKIATQIELWERDNQGQVWLNIVCGDQLARRSKSPYKNGTKKGGSKFPFARCLCYPINSQFWGMGEVAQLESPQDMINRSEAQIADLGRICTAPYMRIHRQSRISLKDITNRIASFIVWDGEVAPDWLPPPGVAGELFAIVDRAKVHMDNMSSVQDAVRGQLPADKISGVAIKSLQKASTGRIALKTRMFEAYLVEVGSQVIDLVKQYYQNETFRIGAEYKTINVIDPTTGQPDPMTDVSSEDFDIEIGVGSTLPIDKGIRAEQSLMLREAGVISRRTTLSKQGWTEEDINKAEKDFDAEKIHDADLEIKIQALAAVTQAATAPPEAAPAESGSEAEGVAPPPAGAAPPPAVTADGGDPLAQLEQEVANLGG